MQKVRIHYSVYLLFVLCNVIIYAQDLPTNTPIDVVPKGGVIEANTLYLSDWVFNKIYNYRWDTFPTEEAKYVYTERTIADNLASIAQVKFIQKPRYDLFLQKINTILRETYISLQIKTDFDSPLYNKVWIQYYQYLWENSIRWQLETYYIMPEHRIQYFDQERKNELLFISVGLVLIKKHGFNISYSFGGVLSPISSDLQDGSNKYFNTNLGIMCGMFGIVKNGVGIGVVIDTDEQIIYDRLWTSALD